MKIKKSLKEKRRYLLFEKNSKEEIEKAILDYVGILGWSRASPIFVNTKDKRLVLSINVAELNNIRAAFELATANIKILRVSGTLKGLKKNK